MNPSNHPTSPSITPPPPPPPRASSRGKLEVGIALAIVAVVLVFGWALYSQNSTEMPPFAVVDDCNAEAGMAMNQPEPPAVDALPDAGTLYGISVANDSRAPARLAYRECLERNGYSSLPLSDPAKEQS